MCKTKEINSFINESLQVQNVCKYVDDNVKIEGEKIKTYKKYPTVVFDSKTFNFHIFPLDTKICEQLLNEYKDLREKIIELIYNKYKKDIESVEQYQKGNDKKQLIIKRNTRTNKLMGPGSNGSIRGLSCLEKNRAGNGLYKYVEIYYKGNYYTINFMRYTCGENKVGCTMRAIQFHKGQYVNKGNCGIDICYPETDGDNDCKKNNAGNICYNPPVNFPEGDNIDKQLDNIVGRFLDFVENEGSIANNEKEI